LPRATRNVTPAAVHADEPRWVTRAVSVSRRAADRALTFTRPISEAVTRFMCRVDLDVRPLCRRTAVTPLSCDQSWTCTTTRSPAPSASPLTWAVADSADRPV